MINKKFKLILIKHFFIYFLACYFLTNICENIDIQEDINLSFVCDLEKIIKNSEYNYKTFSQRFR